MPTHTCPGRAGSETPGAVTTGHAGVPPWPASVTRSGSTRPGIEAERSRTHGSQQQEATRHRNVLQEHDHLNLVRELVVEGRGAQRTEAREQQRDDTGAISERDQRARTDLGKDRALWPARASMRLPQTRCRRPSVPRHPSTLRVQQRDRVPAFLSGPSSQSLSRTRSRPAGQSPISKCIGSTKRP
jgi:hypothetical protein